VSGCAGRAARDASGGAAASLDFVMLLLVDLYFHFVFLPHLRGLVALLSSLAAAQIVGS
jgi:hypothetical protein